MKYLLVFGSIAVIAISLYIFWKPKNKEDERIYWSGKVDVKQAMINSQGGQGGEPMAYGEAPSSMKY